MSSFRGDRGVDIRVWTPDGQVKRYSRPVMSTKARNVEASPADPQSRALDAPGGVHHIDQVQQRVKQLAAVDDA
ncbi:hypothetical protein IL992_44015 [Microbispora sp. NEAU-D428]|uniref:hypothetical protein n=1 Tax=Microbispora sitophila TaxID=2771537 RepID=UPI00186873FF|nr:hypothetical protein [Microbispora sitophila]MBE3016067.1 hypothetical protein [Microbispora sitophila]